MSDSLRQKTKTYSVNLNVPNTPLNLDQVDQWLENAFEINVDFTHEDNIHHILHRAMLVIKELLQAVKLPVYHDGKIINITSDPKNSNNLKVDLALGYIDFTPDQVYIEIINFSMKAIFWMMGNPVSAYNKQNFYKLCVDRIVNPILPMMPGGYSRLHLLRYAYENNIPFSHLGSGVYQLGWGSKAKKMDRGTVETDSFINAKTSGNKLESARLCRLAGLPAPVHGVAQDIKSAKMIANELSFPVVVKPLDANGGQGVTIDITDEKSLKRAFNEAIQFSHAKKVIVEKQVEGVCYRVLIARDQHLYTVKRDPISVQGNGVDTIATLIEKANRKEEKKAPWKRHRPFPHDNLASKELQKLGLDFDSIPEKDKWIPLRNIETMEWGGRTVNVTTSIHPDNIDIAIRAAKQFDLNLVGVDIITSDITKPWYETGAIINEVNLSPTFGGSETEKNLLPIIYDGFIENDGRIPVDVFIGNTKSTLEKAQAKQKEYIEAGLKCYLTTQNKTYDDKNNVFHMVPDNLMQRVQALLLHRDVDAIIIVVENDEFLHTSLPLDKVSSVTVVSKKIQSVSDNANTINTEELEKLVAVFKS